MSVDTAEFPASIDYLALGHLHDAHTLKTPHDTVIRYPGAPAAVSFRELEVPKSVTVIDTEDIKNPREISLPAFQEMRQLRGTREELEKELSALAAAAVIAAVTFVICAAGLIIGKKAGTKLAGKAGILGGAILIFIGLEIFITSWF